MSANPDGSDLKVIVEEGRKLPDGLAVDAAAGHLYWTNMGNLKANDGSILRSDLDGRHMTTIVPPGGTFTPKQLQVDKGNGKLYWSDREGMRVMRANLDGSNIETLVDTSEGDARPGPDARKWCVGIAVDLVEGKFYWTQKGGDNAGEGRVFRANVDIPPGQTAARRKDIELLYENLPEPIDLELDSHNRMEPCAHRSGLARRPQGARDSVHALDGGHRPCARSQGRPHVHHRLRRFAL